MAQRWNQMMSGALILSIYVLVLALFIAVASSERACSMRSTPHPNGLCGSKIDEALSIICGQDGFREKIYKKRSVTAGISPSLLHMDANSFIALMKQNAQREEAHRSIIDVMLPRAQATTFLDKRGSFYQKGVSCECCYNSCSIGELCSYCKNPKKTAMSLLSLV